MEYYNYFRIEIISFMDFSEIITSFFDIIVVTIFFLATFLTVYFLIGNPKDNFLNSPFAFIEKNTRRIRNRFLQFVAFFFLLILIMGPILFFFGFITGTLTPYNGNFFKGLDLPFYILLASLIIMYLLLRLKKANSTGFIAGLVVLIVLSSTGYVYIMANQEVNNVRKNKKNIGVSIELSNGKEMQSDGFNYYIGKTNNYLFFYHEKENQTEVFKMDQVNKLSFK